MIISWFSAGVSSAVATKLVADKIDHIIYTHIDDQHPDTMRFIKDCEKWFGKPVEILQSPYKSVEGAIRSGTCLNRPKQNYYPCTVLLKRRVRGEWELGKDDLTYVWGMDSTEAERCDRLRKSMPDQQHIFPLYDRKIGKNEAHEILRASGIRRPAMYDLGYHNNNCIGCLRGGMGYWNKIRIDFPEKFEQMARLERLMGGSCIKGVFLDELDPDAGNHADMIMDDCGIFCEVMAL